MHENSLGNYACLYHRQREVTNVYLNLHDDYHMHWCKENPEMEKLRLNAERALRDYMTAITSLCGKEEQIINESLLKKKSIF